MADADRAALTAETPIPDDRLAELGVELHAAKPGHPGVSAVRRTGSTLFLSGQLATTAGELRRTGRVGAELTLAEGQECARDCAINLIAQLSDAVGNLSDVAAIVKLTVFVASAEGFREQHLVANGASELFTTVFGDHGRHARSAIGVLGLPKGSPVEVEAIVELHESDGQSSSS